MENCPPGTGRILCSQTCIWASTKSNNNNSRGSVSSVQLLSCVWSLQPHGLPHTRSPCPSPAPRAYSNLGPLSRWCRPTISSLSSPSPPALNLSQHPGLFKWVSSSHQVAKVLGFSFSISPSNEYSGLISFRMDWLDLLAVQGTLKSLLQHHSSKASILRCSAVFMFHSHIHSWLLEKP